MLVWFITLLIGSTYTTGTNGSRISSVPQVDHSTVAGPFMSLTNDSAFEAHPTVTKKSRNSSLTRKLSIDPFVRLKVDKLNAVSFHLV